MAPVSPKTNGRPPPQGDMHYFIKVVSGQLVTYLHQKGGGESQQPTPSTDSDPQGLSRSLSPAHSRCSINVKRGHKCGKFTALRKNLQFRPAGPLLSPHTESQKTYNLPNVLEKV